MFEQIDPQEEEYQFEDLGTTDVEQEGVKFNEQTIVGRTEGMRKKIFIVAGGVIGLVILYNVVTMITSTPSTNEEGKIVEKIIPKTPGISAQKRPKLAAQPFKMPEVKPRPIVKTAPVPTSAPSAEVQAEVAKLNATLQDLKQTLVDFDSRLTDLNYSQENIKQSLDLQKKEIKTLKVRKKSAAGKMAMEKKKYYIKAIIPGRVWLESEDGRTHTIKLGDKLPGYGEVRDIDYENDEVVMSSGDTIAFNPADV